MQGNCGCVVCQRACCLLEESFLIAFLPAFKYATVMTLRDLARWTPVYPMLQRWAFARRSEREYRAWQLTGRPVPPPPTVKHRLLRAVGREFKLRTLVETGTFFGDTISALMGDFDRLYTIELSDDYYQHAVKRFARASKVRLLHGDSGVLLKQVVAELEQPALFWLDAHYSSGNTALGESYTPAREELGHILGDGKSGHVVIIDDERDFAKSAEYPRTEALIQQVKDVWPHVEVNIHFDCIILTPRPLPAEIPAGIEWR